MPLETLPERVRLGARDRFVLWQSAFDFDLPSRVLRDEKGRIAAFDSSEEERAYAAARGHAVGSYPPGVDPTNDLDVVAAWAAYPEPASLDRETIANVWMLLRDAQALPGMYDDNLDPALDNVVWQLDAAEMAASDPQRFGYLAPAWTAEDLALLAQTLSGAISLTGGISMQKSRFTESQILAFWRKERAACRWRRFCGCTAPDGTSGQLTL